MKLDDHHQRQDLMERPIKHFSALHAAFIMVAGVAAAALLLGATREPLSGGLPASTPTAASSLPSPSADILQLDEDGIPTILDGRPVFRGGEVAAAAASATDDRRFLIAGWLMQVMSDCYAPNIRTELEDPCANWFVRDKPSSFVMRGDVHRIILTGLPSLPRLPGPIVLEVHVHDIESHLCGAETRERCRSRLVADAVLWTADQRQ